MKKLLLLILLVAGSVSTFTGDAFHSYELANFTL